MEDILPHGLNKPATNAGSHFMQNIKSHLQARNRTSFFCLCESLEVDIVLEKVPSFGIIGKSVISPFFALPSKATQEPWTSTEHSAPSLWSSRLQMPSSNCKWSTFLSWREGKMYCDFAGPSQHVRPGCYISPLTQFCSVLWMMLLSLIAGKTRNNFKQSYH